MNSLSVFQALEVVVILVGYDTVKLYLQHRRAKRVGTQEEFTYPYDVE